MLNIIEAFYGSFFNSGLCNPVRILYLHLSADQPLFRCSLVTNDALLDTQV